MDALEMISMRSATSCSFAMRTISAICGLSSGSPCPVSESILSRCGNSASCSMVFSYVSIVMCSGVKSYCFFISAKPSECPQ